MKKIILAALALALVPILAGAGEKDLICDKGKVAIEFSDGWHCAWDNELLQETPVEERVYDPNEKLESECEGEGAVCPEENEPTDGVE